MRIRELKDEEKPAFNALARSCGTVFNTVEWTDMFNGAITRCGLFNDGGELIGGFNMYRQSRFGLSVYRDPPYTPMIGPFLRVDASNPVAVMSLWKDAVGLMADWIDRLPCSLVSLSMNGNLVDMQPFIWKKFKVVPAYTYVLDLARSVEEIRKRMSGERRKNILKAEKDGVSIKAIADYEEVASLARKTFARQNLQIENGPLHNLLFTFAGRANSYAFAALRDGRPVACSFVVHDDRTAYYLVGGYDEGMKHHGAGALAMWEAVKHAKNLGLERFDFEGSMIPAIERYFRGFGGELRPYFRINKARLPLELILKFYRRELF